MTDDDEEIEAKPTGEHDRPAPSAPPDDSSLPGMFRALKVFLVPFMLSWAFAYVGSAQGTEWLYYAGLGGVTLSLVVLMIWLVS